MTADDVDEEPVGGDTSPGLPATVTAATVVVALGFLIVQFLNPRLSSQSAQQGGAIVSLIIPIAEIGLVLFGITAAFVFSIPFFPRRAKRDELRSAAIRNETHLLSDIHKDISNLLEEVLDGQR